MSINIVSHARPSHQEGKGLTSCNGKIGNSCSRSHTTYNALLRDNRTRERACSTRLELYWIRLHLATRKKTSFLLEKENAYCLFLLLFQTAQAELTSTATKYSLDVHCFAIKSDWDLPNCTPGTSAPGQDFSKEMKTTTAWMKHSLLYRVVHVSIYLA